MLSLLRTHASYKHQKLEMMLVLGELPAGQTWKCTQQPSRLWPRLSCIKDPRDDLFVGNDGLASQLVDVFITFTTFVLLLLLKVSSRFTTFTWLYHPLSVSLSLSLSVSLSLNVSSRWGKNFHLCVLCSAHDGQNRAGYVTCAQKLSVKGWTNVWGNTFDCMQTLKVPVRLR